MQQEERRKHTRYQDLDLELTVARRGIVGFLKLNPIADCMDFSLSGLQYRSSQRFKLDEKVVLDLKIRNLELHEINAVVIDSERLEANLFCTRVKFCFQDRRMKNPRIMLSLLKMVESFRLAKQFPT